MPKSAKPSRLKRRAVLSKKRPRRRAADSAERAYQVIRQQLIEFKMRPDERINEVHFAQMLDLSRTPVREALNRLASEGFVISEPNKGYYFRGLNIDDLVHSFEMRSIIETGAFAFACDRAEDADIAKLQTFWEHARRRYERHDTNEILELDEGFHIHLAELAKNPEIVRQLMSINARIRFIRGIQIENGKQDHVRFAEDHTRIVEAISKRDQAKGIELLNSHISITVSDARAILKDALLKIFVSEPNSASRGRVFIAAK
jgi:DNA-binding GntR family transcriptional regulator